MSAPLTYTEVLEQLRGAYERENIQFTSHISSLQITVNEQASKIKELEKELQHKEQDCYA